MKLTKKITLALGLLAVAGTGFAQQSATSGVKNGVLGQSYTELSFGTQDIKHLSTNGYGLGASQSTPVTANVDVAGGYSYNWIKGNIRAHSNTLNGVATAFTTWNGVKPYASAGLGYQWESGRGFHDNYGLWGAAVGVEIPVCAEATVTPSINYVDDFRGARQSTQQTTFGVEANYWFSKDAAAFAGLGYSDVRRSSFDSWNYTIGLRIKL